MIETQAEFVLSTKELKNDLTFFTNTLGMKLDSIYPADDPSVAVLSGHGVRVRIEKGTNHQTGMIRINTTHPETFANGVLDLIAPNGPRIEIRELNPQFEIPSTKHSFVVRKLKDRTPWIIGRAGMHYRDLIPDRLGGSIIASHIRIPDGGPVPDMVHYHKVGFQLIYCYKGWVDLVYEDQGPAFRLFEGNCVIQPPEIRHKVLYASKNIEVIEIGVPAEHVTTIDHEMTLPNNSFNPDRLFSGQKFVHYVSAEATIADFRIQGLKSIDTMISLNTGNVAGVQVVQATETETEWTSHNADILFNFVLEGKMTLHSKDQKIQELSEGDAFVTPPNFHSRYTDISSNLKLLEVSLPGVFETARINA